MDPDSQTLRTLWLENGRLQEEIYAIKAEVEELRQILRALNTLQYNIDKIGPDTDVLALIHSILSSALSAVGSNDGALLLLDHEDNDLVFVDVIGLDRNKLTGYRISSRQGVAGWVINNKAPTLIKDVSQDRRWSPMLDNVIGFKTASLICVPLVDGGRPLGVIEVVNPVSGEPFNETDMDIMMLVARLASLALAQAESFVR